MKKTWNYACVVTQHDKTSNTNEAVTTKTNTVHMKRDTLQSECECARSLLFSFVQSCVVIFTHCTPHRMAQVVRVSHLIHS